MISSSLIFGSVECTRFGLIESGLLLILNKTIGIKLAIHTFSRIVRNFDVSNRWHPFSVKLSAFHYNIQQEWILNDFELECSIRLDWQVLPEFKCCIFSLSHSKIGKKPVKQQPAIHILTKYMQLYKSKSYTINDRIQMQISIVSENCTWKWYESVNVIDLRSQMRHFYYAKNDKLAIILLISQNFRNIYK